jgi:hypothetical protein
MLFPCKRIYNTWFAKCTELTNRATIKIITTHELLTNHKLLSMNKFLIAKYVTRKQFTTNKNHLYNCTRSFSLQAQAKAIPLLPPNTAGVLCHHCNWTPGYALAVVHGCRRHHRCRSAVRARRSINTFDVAGELPWSNSQTHANAVHYEHDNTVLFVKQLTTISHWYLRIYKLWNNWELSHYTEQPRAPPLLAR